MSEETQLEIDVTHAGSRLDQALARIMTDYSRAQIQGWIKEGLVQVDGGACKANQKVLGGEQVTVRIVLASTENWGPEELETHEIYADEDLLVVDKPPGVVVHPGAGNTHGTLINGLIHRYPELAGLPRCGIVHRIDKDTSGLLVVARSSRAHKTLVEQLAGHEVSREYLAIVHGEMTGGATIDQPIGRHPRHRIRMAVVQSGKPAVTHYRLEKRYRSFTHVRVALETGRTHQIRVHMAHNHHPLVGDPLYGGRNRLPAGASETLREAISAFPRQALHACQLQLRHPGTGDLISWSSPLPDDFQHMLGVLDEEDLPC